MGERPSAPQDRKETVRTALREHLLREPLTAKELSGRVGIPEKQVALHLQHLQRSLRPRRERLLVTPAACIACGFTFATRTRLTRPGRCPSCTSERIDPPQFRVRVEGAED